MFCSKIAADCRHGCPPEAYWYIQELRKTNIYQLPQLSEYTILYKAYKISCVYIAHNHLQKKKKIVLKNYFGTKKDKLR